MNARNLTIAVLLGVAGWASYALLFRVTATTTYRLDGPSSAQEEAAPARGVEGPTYHVGGFEVAPTVLVLAAVLTVLLLAVAASMIARGGRRRALRCFVVTSCVAASLGAYLCVYRLDLEGTFFLSVTAFVLAPLASGFGIAWARSLERPRATWSAVAAVLVVSAAPVSMLLHPWPLHAAFLVSSAALERSADDALAGRALELPRWVGLFRVVDVAVEDGRVALITDADPSGRSGLVRVVASAPRPADAGPMYNLNWDLPLGARWRYQNED